MIREDHLIMLSDDESQALNSLPEADQKVFLSDLVNNIYLFETKQIGTFKPTTDTHAREFLQKMQRDFGPKQFKQLQNSQQTSAKRSFESLKNKFSSNFRQKVDSYLEGKIRFTRMKKEVSDSLRSIYQKSFLLGMKASGLLRSKTVPEFDQISESDKRWIASSVKDEMKYLNKFFDDLVGIKEVNEIPSVPIHKRIDMYKATLDHLFHAGRVIGSPADVIIDWVSTRKENVCDGCRLFESWSPFTKLTLPTTPRAGATPCLFHCYCKLVVRKAPPARILKLEGKARPVKTILKDSRKIQEGGKLTRRELGHNRVKYGGKPATTL